MNVSVNWMDSRNVSGQLGGLHERQCKLGELQERQWPTGWTPGTSVVNWVDSRTVSVNDLCSGMQRRFGFTIAAYVLKDSKIAAYELIRTLK